MKRVYMFCVSISISVPIFHSRLFPLSCLPHGQWLHGHSWEGQDDVRCHFV